MHNNAPKTQTEQTRVIFHIIYYHFHDRKKIFKNKVKNLKSWKMWNNGEFDQFVCSFR
jgi:hypothetical protein